MNRWILALAVVFGATGLAWSGDSEEKIPAWAVDLTARVRGVEARLAAAEARAERIDGLVDWGKIAEAKQRRARGEAESDDAMKKTPEYSEEVEERERTPPLPAPIPAGLVKSVLAEPAELHARALIGLAAKTEAEDDDDTHSVAVRRQRKARRMSRWSYVAVRVARVSASGDTDVIAGIEPVAFDPRSGECLGRWVELPAYLEGSRPSARIRRSPSGPLAIPLDVATSMVRGDVIVIRVEWVHGSGSWPWTLTYASHHPAKAGK